MTVAEGKAAEAEAVDLLREWRAAAAHLTMTGELTAEVLAALRSVKVATDGYFNRRGIAVEPKEKG
jgi:hypothetical protein